jgi:hypothetical protein
VPLLVIFLLALLLGGLGFAVHVLWLIAVIVLVFWLIGFAVGRGQRMGRRGRWRHW